MRNISVLLAASVLLLNSCVSKPVTAPLDTALEAGDYKNAYHLLIEACESDPDDKVCARFDSVRSRYAQERISRLWGILVEVNARPMPMDVLDRLDNETSEIEAMGFGTEPSETEEIEPDKEPSDTEEVEPGKEPSETGEVEEGKGASETAEAEEAKETYNPVETGLTAELVRVREAIAAEKEATRATAIEAAGAAPTLFDEGMWREAVDSYSYALKLDREVREGFDAFKRMASAELYRIGDEAAAKVDWRMANKAFTEVAYIDKDYKDIGKRAKEAREKDKLEFYVAESDKAEKNGEYKRAAELQKYTFNYGETDELKAQYTDKALGCVESLFTMVAREVDGDRPLGAGIAFLDGTYVLGTVDTAQRTTVKVPADKIKRLLNELYFNARKLKEKKKSGLAYLYARTLLDIQPNYPGGAKIMKALKREIEDRATKSLAVIPFKGPSYFVDAGGVLTSHILDFLHKDLSKDVRILERGAIENLLQESVVKTLQNGGESEEDSSEMLQLTGADYLILGDVVNYWVESNVSDTHKTVRARTGTRKVPNPAHKKWLKLKKRKQKKAPEPPEQLDEPILEDIKYKVTNHRKTANISLSYRIVDSKGFVVYTGITEKKVEAEDDAAEGIELGEFKVPLKIASVLTDHELLGIAENDVVKNITKEIKAIFSDAEKKLLKKALILKKAKNYSAALGKAVDSLFISTNKGLDTEEVESLIEDLIIEGQL